MNQKIFFYFLLIVLGWQSGCVSSKKYKTLQGQLENQRKNLKICNDSLMFITALKDSLELQYQIAKEEIQQLNSKLEAKTRFSDSLQSELELKIAMIETCQEHLDNIKSKSSKEIQELIASLEQLQEDLSSREQKLREFEKMIAQRDAEIQNLIAKLTEALKPYQDSGLEVKLKNGEIEVSLSNQLLFALGSTEIDKKGKEALKEFAKVISSHSNVNFMIYVEGHTDDIPVTNLGDIKDNWDLSVMRSTAVIRYLTKECKVDPTLLVASGRGQYEPVVEGKTNEARAKNRRTEILIIPNLENLFKTIERK